VQDRRGGGVDECEPVETLAGPDCGEEAAQRDVEQTRRRGEEGLLVITAAAAAKGFFQELQRGAGVGDGLGPRFPRRPQRHGVQRRPEPVVDERGPEAVHGALVRVLRHEPAAATAAVVGGLVDVLDDDGGLADGAAVGEEQHGDLAVHRVGGEEALALARDKLLVHQLVGDPAQLQRQPRARRERAQLPAQQPHLCRGCRCSLRVCPLFIYKEANGPRREGKCMAARVDGPLRQCACARRHVRVGAS
jgi:hypothetical protein